MSMQDCFRRALANVIRHGDTDIFPFPFEHLVFNDRQQETLSILNDY
jgi:hypothetical protein